jgi:uncharacterized lipoprotein YddW (UPF0748 family)
MTNTRSLRFAWLAAALAAVGGWLVGCRTAAGPPAVPGAPARGVVPRPEPLPLTRPVRGIWVDRFKYHYADDVRQIIRNCAELGCNTVFWQVRGEGTVAYRSKLEPWAREYNFTDPGFDPLKLAVEEAHKYRMRIEAWVNVLPGWKGKTAPPVRGQLWNAHPDWFLQDARGNRQAPGDFYLIVNPCLPQVRQHIVAVMDEIVRNYDVDGVHMDYVRYAWDEERDAAQKYPRDSRTLSIYERETGRRPDDDAAAWKNWRGNQLTRLVAEIRTAVNRRRPGATLTAAVVRNPRSAYDQYFQNGVAWLRTGLVDALMPMAYTDKLAEFESDIGAYRRLAGSGRIVPAVGIYKHNTAAAMREQLSRCNDWGGDFAVFSYGSLYPTHEDRAKTKPSAAEQAARQWRRSVLGEFTGRARVE